MSTNFIMNHWILSIIENVTDTSILCPQVEHGTRMASARVKRIAM